MQLARMPGAPRTATGARVATWNVGWATPGSKRGDRVTALLRGLDADILVVTEGYGGLLPDEDHVIHAGDDWGYTTVPGRRKTLAWSRHPWRDVRRMDEGAGKGRVVAGVTDTKAGPVEVIAVCISMARRARAHRTTRRGGMGRTPRVLHATRRVSARPWCRPVHHRGRLQPADPANAPTTEGCGVLGRGIGGDDGVDAGRDLARPVDRPYRWNRRSQRGRRRWLVGPRRARSSQ